MKGWRFYEEFETRKRKVSEGNVVAVSTTVSTFVLGGPPQYECVLAVFYTPDSPVMYGSVAVEYVNTYCKRISEEKARKIHPKLFEYLEMEE